MAIDGLAHSGWRSHRTHTALDVDPSWLFRMAVAQSNYKTTQTVIDDIFGTLVSRNEVAWLE
jgi:hypothetical protein